MNKNDNEPGSTPDNPADGQLADVMPRQRAETPGYDPRAEADGMAAVNDAALHEMARNGTPVPDYAILATQIGALVDHILGPTYHVAPNGNRVVNIPRAEYDCELQRAFTTNIAQWKSQIAQAVLLNGVRRQN